MAAVVEAKRNQRREPERGKNKNKKQTVQYLCHGTCLILLSLKLVLRVTACRLQITYPSPIHLENVYKIRRITFQ